ncbi:MAG: Uma2 family endonuclease, partial [Chloroflexota bacterium]|nr:Uma2 family endonuclease [Chloroflexota bacterium]
HGIIAEDDDVELIDGWIVEKMSKNQRHTFATWAFNRVINALLPGGWFVMTKQPALILNSLPEPDGMVVKGDARAYISQRIPHEVIRLIVEAAESSLVSDRGDKLDLYARAGIPVYWIVNLNRNEIEVYSQPATNTDATGRYQTRTVYAAADTIPFTLDGVTIAQIPAADLLP